MSTSPRVLTAELDDLASLERLRVAYDTMRAEISKVVIGQDLVIEAMQAHHVTSGGRLYKLPEPFFVLATQNPIEQEGTYPLPEAQLDRFMYMIAVGYPSADEEMAIMRATTSGTQAEVFETLNE